MSYKKLWLKCPFKIDFKVPKIGDFGVFYLIIYNSAGEFLSLLNIVSLTKFL